jgi:cytidylate kinase
MQIVVSSSLPIITVDGPVGSGKGTLSVMLAEKLGFNLLDSGAIYRVLALALKKHNIDLHDESKISQEAVNLNVEFKATTLGQPAAVILDGKDVSLEIRQEQCGSLASEISKYPAVRAALMGRQRSFLKPPGLVADGRDMGTVVFPDANLKFFLTASQEVRAQRRFDQLKYKDSHITFEQLLEEIKIRDDRDINRSLSPLKPAADAIIINSSAMTLDQVFAQILVLVSKRI